MSLLKLAMACLVTSASAVSTVSYLSNFDNASNSNFTYYSGSNATYNSLVYDGIIPQTGAGAYLTPQSLPNLGHKLGAIGFRMVAKYPNSAVTSFAVNSFYFGCTGDKLIFTATPFLPGPNVRQTASTFCGITVQGYKRDLAPNQNLDGRNGYPELSQFDVARTFNFTPTVPYNTAPEIVQGSSALQLVTLDSAFSGLRGVFISISDIGSSTVRPQASDLYFDDVRTTVTFR